MPRRESVSQAVVADRASAMIEMIKVTESAIAYNV